MKKYKLIYLDADNTLLNYTASEKQALSETLNSVDIPCTAENLDLYAAINKKLWQKFEQGVLDQVFLRSERFRLLLEAISFKADYKQMSAVYLENLSASCFKMPFADEICAILSDYCELGIMTNGIAAVQRQRLKKSGLMQYFSYLIISEEAKAHKPNKEIFEYAESISNVRKKEELLMVGDSLSSDILGGNNYGIDTCWYNPEKVKNHSDIQATFTIHTLLELENIVKNRSA